MNRPVDTYRDLYRTDLSVFRPVKGEKEILASLEENWKEASKKSVNIQWPLEERAARRIWAGVGFLVFGRLRYLMETFETIEQYPQAAKDVTCRYYVPAIDKLLPLPRNMSPISNPKAVLEWLKADFDRLQWSEKAGRFVCSASTKKTACSPISSSNLFSRIVKGLG